jgi:hypothetical protein
VGMTTSILVGDCRQVLTTLADESIQCVVTSPPYWGLRDYGTGVWEGGDPACQHRSPTMREGRNEDRDKLAGSAATNSYQLLLSQHRPCGKCGAVKKDAQLGLEPTPDDYIDQIVDVFREVRRILRKDGTVWLNLGDSYTDSGRGTDPKQGSTLQGTCRNQAESRKVRVRETVNSGLRPKNLVGIPWRTALALQADGSGRTWIVSREASERTPPFARTGRSTRPSSAASINQRKARSRRACRAATSGNSRPSKAPTSGTSGTSRRTRSPSSSSGSRR